MITRSKNRWVAVHAGIWLATAVVGSWLALGYGPHIHLDRKCPETGALSTATSGLVRDLASELVGAEVLDGQRSVHRDGSCGGGAGQPGQFETLRAWTPYGKTCSQIEDHVWQRYRPVALDQKAHVLVLQAPITSYQPVAGLPGTAVTVTCKPIQPIGGVVIIRSVPALESLR